MSGHLFIVQGDLTRLACDAWLLPTGRGLQIRNIWLTQAPGSLLKLVTKSDNDELNDPSRRGTWHFDGLLTTPPGWHDRRVRSFEVREWPTEDDVARPWATQIVVNPDWTASEIAERVTRGARDFVRSAAAALLKDEPGRDKSPKFGRHRHLLALPVVGTGHGGGWASAGAILDHLVPLLSEEVRQIDADIALVTFTDDQFAAAQHARRKLVESGNVDEHWGELSPSLRETGRDLAARSVEGKLVLFVGAGVSNSAGLPTWQGLLNDLAIDAGFDAPEQQALKRLPDVDQARLIKDRLERTSIAEMGTLTLAEAICERVKSDRYGMAHALLACFPVTQTVTTNYDTLFERASDAAGYPTAVLPYESSRAKRRWLLKMHGCITHSEDIVLTREDFLRYSERRGALAAIVQAMLITHHMLFVGFSLRDDNFQRVADEVRKVMRPSAAGGARHTSPFGTALLLNPSSLFQSLWQGDIACVGIGDGTGELEQDQGQQRVSMRSAANQLEILLDYVLFEANQNVGHLLDDRYTDLLNRDERALKQHLLTLRDAATSGTRSLPAWGLVAELLTRLGGREN